MRESLGEFEQLVLLAILRLDDRAYGVTVLEEIVGQTARPVSRAAVYIALRRMQQKNLVESRLADPTPERGGRAKRYYLVLPAGLRQLRRSRRDLLNLWEGLQEVLDEA